VEKAPDAFRTISEVADELDVPQHVLRFWESRFHEIKPMKRGGGRRYYRPNDLDLLRGIRHLLYSEGYTIRGVQRLLREQGLRFVQSVWQEGAPQPTYPRGDDPEDDAAMEPPAEEELQAPPLAGKDAGPEQRSAPPLAPHTPAPPPVAPAGLAREDVQKLEVALRELTECRRLLEDTWRETR
jgi:DNA-binding transcriptional MerR regulator